MKANTNTNTNNATKVNARQEYAKSKERKIRTFSVYNREILADVDVLYLADVRNEYKTAQAVYKTGKTDANKANVDRLKKRVELAESAMNDASTLRDVEYLKMILDRARLSRDDINPSFIHTYAPECVVNGQFVKISKVQPERIAETRARYSGNLNVSFVIGEDANVYKRTLIDVWTCRDLMNLYARAARNRVKAITAKSQAERDADTLARLRAEEERATERAKYRRAKINALESAERAYNDANIANATAKADAEREILANATADADAINAKDNE